MRIRVIGGGLAGPEAALVAARMGVDVDLYEMRPVRSTPAHQTADFGELVCSNSLKSESENTTPWPWTASNFHVASTKPSNASRASLSTAKKSRSSTPKTVSRLLRRGP